MRVFLSIFFILIIGIQNPTYCQVFGLDSSYLIPNKESYFAERIFELSDSSFLVTYSKKGSVSSSRKDNFEKLNAFGIYEISKEEIYFNEFSEKINYVGKTDDKLVFADTKNISTFDLKALTFDNELALTYSSQLLHLDATFGDLYFYDSLNHGILSKNLFSGELLYKFDLNPDFENYHLALASNEKQVCFAIKDKTSSAARIYYLDHYLHLTSSIDISINSIVPWGSSVTYIGIIPKTNSESFLLEVIDYGEGTHFKYFEISKTGNKVFDNKGFYHIKQLENGLAFISTLSKWESLNSNIQIRVEMHDFAQINGDFYALDTAGVRKLKDGLIYLDLIQPVQHYEYLSKFHVLQYETNSASPPNFKIEGPGYISNDTVFFKTAGTIKVIASVPQAQPSSQEITIVVGKSSPAFNIRSCEHSNFWNLPSDLPLNYQIEVQNPYQNELEASIQGGNGTYENGILAITEFTENVFNLSIQSIENENFQASQVITCHYYIAFPGSNDTSSLEVYPNPISGKTFYIRLPSSERDKIPKLKLYDLNGKAVKFKMLVADPFNYEIYIPKPTQGTYILKNMSSNTSARVIFN